MHALAQMGLTGPRRSRTADVVLPLVLRPARVGVRASRHVALLAVEDARFLARLGGLRRDG